MTTHQFGHLDLGTVGKPQDDHAEHGGGLGSEATNTPIAANIAATTGHEDRVTMIPNWLRPAWGPHG